MAIGACGVPLFLLATASQSCGQSRIPLRWITDPSMKGAVLTFGPGDYARQLKVDGLDRYYEIHVPPGYEKTKAWPLVLVFHGGGGHPGTIRYESGLDRTADQGGFLVAYPAGTAKSGALNRRALLWNDGRPFRDGTFSPVDDVGFVRTLLDDVSALFHVDPQRVYAAGYSNGAQFSYRLAQQMSGRIAAIAAVAGQRPPDQLFPKPPRPVAVLQFAGLQDRIAPYHGGVPAIDAEWQTNIKPVRESVAAWAALDGCPAEPASTKRVGMAVAFYYGPGRDGTEVVLWTLEDGGHTWPGGNVVPLPGLARLLGNVNRDIRASDLMWEFFRRHPLDKAGSGTGPGG
ncbi:MAG: PHB depolymerase family esterase [Thermoguttaceae bacterium]